MRPQYDGALGIWKNLNLVPIEQIIEHHFADYLQHNLSLAKRQYKAKHGKFLDTDQARTFSSVWNLSDTSRALLSAAVHNPASAFIHVLYHSALRQRARGSVIFTAGGGGSGKSAAIFSGSDIKQIVQEAVLIYDTTLSNQAAAVEKIEAALQYGRNVIILFVYRPFPAAVQGVIQRALLSGGRTVPLNVLAKDHVDSPRTVLHIAMAYAANDNVKIILLDNSGDVANVKIVTRHDVILQFLRNIAYNDTGELLRQAKGILEHEKSEGYIPGYIVEALERNYERGKGA